MILINSPNNPTGAVYSEETMVAIIDLAEQINQKRRLQATPPLCLVLMQSIVNTILTKNRWM